MSQDEHKLLTSSPWLTLTRISLFLSLATPVVYLNSFFFPYVTPKSIFLFSLGLLAFLFLAWFVFSKGGWAPIWSPIATTVAVLVGMHVLAAVFGADPVMSFWSIPGRMTGTFLFLHLFVLFLAMITVLRTRGGWEVFFATSVLVALVTAFLHILSINNFITLYDTRSGSSLGNSTLYGGYLLFQIGMAAYLLATSKRVWIRWYGALAGAALTFSLFFTDARAAQVSLVGGLALAGALTLITRVRVRAARWTGVSFIIAMVVGFMLMVGLLFVPGSAVRDTFIGFTDQARLIVWNIAWKGFLDRPLLGWGPENFELVFAKYYDPCFGSAECGVAYWFDRAHNIVLDMLAQTGILGFATYAAVFIVTLRLLWKSFCARKIDDIPAIFVTSTLAAYVVQNLTGFDSIVSLYAWFVLLAFSHFLLTSDEQPHVTRKTIIWIPALVLVIVPFLFSFFVVKPAVAFWSIAAAQDAPSMEERLKLFERAAGVSSAGLAYRRGYLAHQTNVILWHTQPESFARARSAVLIEIAIAKEGLKDTLERLPSELSSLIELGRLYQVEGRFEDASSFARAEEVLKEAMRLHPLNPNAAWALASVFLEQGKVEEAVALTQEVLDRDPSVFKAHTAHLVAVKFLRDDSLLLQTAQASADAIPSIAGQLQFIVSEDIDIQRFLFLGHFY